MLTITRKNYAESIRCTTATVTNRLRNVPALKGPWNEHCYPVADILPTIKDRERHLVPDLFALAEEDGSDSFYIGLDPTTTARRLWPWLDDRQKDRAEIARALCMSALGSNLRSSAMFEYWPAVSEKMILWSPVLRYICVHDRRGLDRVTGEEYAAFAVLHMDKNFKTAA